MGKTLIQELLKTKNLLRITRGSSRETGELGDFMLN